MRKVPDLRRGHYEVQWRNVSHAPYIYVCITLVTCDCNVHSFRHVQYMCHVGTAKCTALHTLCRCQASAKCIYIYITVYDMCLQKMLAAYKSLNLGSKIYLDGFKIR
jgi:hypothetical protein